MRFNRRSGSHTLSVAVRRALFPLLIGGVAVVIGVAGLLGWLLVNLQPRLTSIRAADSAVRTSHEAMLDQETGLRGFLSTGRPAFLNPYTQGVVALAGADANALRYLSQGHSALLPAISATVGAQQSWTDQWAKQVADGTWQRLADVNRDGRVSDLEQATYLSGGKALFDAYRAQYASVLSQIEHAINTEQRHEDVLMSTVAIGVLLVAVIGLGEAARRQRHLRSDVVLPIEELLTQVQAVSAGDLRLAELVAAAGPVSELALLSSGVVEMTAALAAQRSTATAREATSSETIKRLRHVIELSRELSASLSVRYVVTSLVKALTTVGGAQTAQVWLQVQESHTLLRYDEHGLPTQDIVEVGEGAVGRAAQYARVLPLEGRLEASVANSPVLATGAAIPMVIGARIIGVVTATPPEGSQLHTDLIDALVLQGAAAVQSARLHTQAEELSRRDPLTNLANRRQLDEDLTVEVERARRYDRPLSFIMFDLDHFKRVNDTYGHPRGDEVLQEVSTLIDAELRVVDSAYRYGGEELCVLLRECPLGEGHAIAERIRVKVAERFPWAREATITISGGIAELTDAIGSPGALIAAADQALYDAKQAGRNTTRPELVVAPVGH